MIHQEKDLDLDLDLDLRKDLDLDLDLRNDLDNFLLYIYLQKDFENLFVKYLHSNYRSRNINQSKEMR